MRLLKKCLPIAVLCVVSLHYNGHTQFLKKLKEKVNNAVGNKVSNTVDQSTQTSGTTSNSGNPTNKMGGGLTNTTPPDVNQQMADAEKSHAAGDFSDARYSLKQALMGIELQIGKEILRSLPATAKGLEKDTSQNKVMSTQWGWNNLTIQSIYKKGDQQMTITIGNNAAYSVFVNMYFNNAYAQTNNDNSQKVKQTKVKGYKAIITYEDSKGYTLLVPLGQSSLIAWECVNFATEQDVMDAANVFNIDGIKKMLGEQ